MLGYRNSQHAIYLYLTIVVKPECWRYSFWLEVGYTGTDGGARQI